MYYNDNKKKVKIIKLKLHFLRLGRLHKISFSEVTFFLKVGCPDIDFESCSEFNSTHFSVFKVHKSLM